MHLFRRENRQGKIGSARRRTRFEKRRYAKPKGGSLINALSRELAKEVPVPTGGGLFLIGTREIAVREAP